MTCLICLISRWLHILAAMAAVGGPMFIRLAMLPAMATLTEDKRKQLHEQLRRRWSKVVMAAIVFLIASGLYNFISFRNAAVDWGPQWQSGSHNMWLYQMLFGVKVVLALVLFFLASAITGRSDALAKFRENLRLWITVNLLLGILIVCISGQLRMMHAGPTVSKEPIVTEK
jgi:uncharacterized membrane protein